MLTERVRYFPGPESKRKNTLVTLSDGETIYFGISRCNLEAGDNMKKSHGRMIAKARAYRAKAEAMPMPMGGLLIHDSGLRGCCGVDTVKVMLQYFEKVDELMYNDAVKSQNEGQETN